MNIVVKNLVEHMETIKLVKESMVDDILTLGRICKEAMNNGNTIFLMGNGGSAADSQHLAAEFVGRFVKERRGLPAVALTTDTSILTAIGNDYSLDEIFKRQVEALVRSGDIVIGISTSGNSTNVILALEKAKQLGAYTVGLTGKDGGELKRICDICLVVPSEVTARIQEAHILIGHTICEIVEEEM